MTALRNAMPADELERQSADADPARAPWSHTQMLVAALLDTSRLMLHVLIAANSRQSPGDPPAPVRRPGVAGQRKRRRPTLEQRRILDPRMRQPEPEQP